MLCSGQAWRILCIPSTDILCENKKFSVNTTFGNDDILLNSKSSINIVAKVDSFVPDEYSEETVLSISQLQKVFTDQIVTIKATTKSLSGVKKVSVGESPINKRDQNVVEPTGSIRVVL